MNITGGLARISAVLWTVAIIGLWFFFAGSWCEVPTYGAIPEAALQCTRSTGFVAFLIYAVPFGIYAAVEWIKSGFRK